MENTVTEKMCELKHKQIDEDFKTDRSRITQHGLEIKTVQEAIIVLTQIQAQQNKDIKDHEDRLRGIESKPAKRWDSVTAQVIQIVVAGVAGGTIATLF